MSPLLDSPLTSLPLSRRRLLAAAGGGFGMVALAGMLGAREADAKISGTSERLRGGVHHVARAKRVIFLFMNGAPSHVDTFDPKPSLARHEGQTPSGKLYKKASGGWMASPFEFSRHGESGLVMSELFPRLSQCADDLCVVRSMHTDQPNHEPGLLLMNSGNPQPIRPSLGSWASYGLGTENANLPAFVVLCPGRPVVGPQLWSNSFLPGEHQGMAVDTSDLRVDRLVANLRHPKMSAAQQRLQLDLLGSINALHLRSRESDAALEAQIRSFELAYHMQSQASDAFDVSKEPESTREEYGKSAYGQSCLLARRLVERGVRFVEVMYVNKDKQPWDTHSNNDRRHRELCADSDRGTAALLRDLKSRGLLDDTLVIWGGEFGRTPYAQMNKKQKRADYGRDHHHTGFTMFLAGGGTRGGLMYGETDEFGMRAVENRVHVHDLHATVLHLLGIDHEKLTYRYSGRDFRLTDVHGHVVEDVIV